MNLVKVKYPTTNAYTVPVRFGQGFSLCLRFLKTEYEQPDTFVDKANSNNCLNVHQLDFGISLNTDLIKITSVELFESTEEYFDLIYYFDQNHSISISSDVFLGNIYCKNIGINLFVVLSNSPTSSNLIYYCSNNNLDIVVKLKSDQNLLIYLSKDFEYDLTFSSSCSKLKEKIKPVYINGKLFDSGLMYQFNLNTRSGHSNSKYHAGEPVSVLGTYSGQDFVKVMQSYITIYMVCKPSHNICARIFNKNNSPMILVNPGNQEKVEITPINRILIIEILPPSDFFPELGSSDSWLVDFLPGPNNNSDLSLSFNENSNGSCKDQYGMEHVTRIFEFTARGYLHEKHDCSILFSCGTVSKRITLTFPKSYPLVPTNKVDNQDTTKFGMKEIDKIYVEIESHLELPFKKIKLSEVDKIPDNGKKTDDRPFYGEQYYHLPNSKFDSTDLPLLKKNEMDGGDFSLPMTTSHSPFDFSKQINVNGLSNTSVFISNGLNKTIQIKVPKETHRTDLVSFSIIQNCLYLAGKNSNITDCGDYFLQTFEVCLYQEYIPASPQFPFYLGSLRIGHGIRNIFIQFFLKFPEHHFSSMSRDINKFRSDRFLLNEVAPVIKVDRDYVEVLKWSDNHRLFFNRDQKVVIKNVENATFKSIKYSEFELDETPDSWDLDLQGRVKPSFDPVKVGRIVVKKEHRGDPIDLHGESIREIYKARKTLFLSACSNRIPYTFQYQSYNMDLTITNAMDLSSRPVCSAKRIIIEYTKAIENKNSSNLELHLIPNWMTLESIHKNTMNDSECILLKINQNIKNSCEGFVVLSKDVAGARKFIRLQFSFNEKFQNEPR